jgi:hypothetical protein
VLSADGQTEAMQENIHDWFGLDEDKPGLQLLTEEEFAAGIFSFYSRILALPILSNFQFIS